MVAVGPTTELRILIAVAWLAIGGFMLLGSAWMLLPALEASSGGGSAGVFVLTQSPCNPDIPPHKPCLWFGEFHSDDGTIVYRGGDLSLDKPAHAGQTVRARYAKVLGRADVFHEDDTQAWRNPALFTGLGLVGVVGGLLMLEPWSWAERRRARRETASSGEITSRRRGADTGQGD